MQQILNTFYIMTPNAYLHLENDTIRIDVDREQKMQAPLHHTGTVVCFGDYHVTCGWTEGNLQKGVRLHKSHE